MTMRKMISFMALVVAMTAVSCTKNINDGAPAIDGAVKFEASFAVGTKAVLEPGATESKVAWEANDQVSVLAGEGNYLYAAETAGYTTTLATEATGVPSEGPYYAVYPYDAEAVLAAGVVTTVLPAQQTAVLGSFATHLAVAQANGSKFAFKNVAGLVKVTVDAENVTKIVFEGNSGEVVAGAVNVTVADAPVWEPVAEQGATAVTLVPAEGATLAKGAYYFAVLPQTFAAGFKVTAYKGEDASVIRNVAAEFTLERADIIGGKAFGIEGAGTESDPYILKTVQDMKDMRSLAKLGGETWFKMANDIDLAGVNWEPVNWDANFERKIHFDGGNYTISNLTSDKAKSQASYPSLFGVLYGSCKNLKVDKAVITSTSGCGVIGGYVGTTSKPAVLENVTITNSSVTNAGDRCGGVCGTAKEATFKNVSFQGTVTSTYTGEAKSGGFVGQTETKVVFVDCTVDVIFDGKGMDTGGFAGKLLNENEFTGCDVTVTMTSGASSKNRCGGFVGWNSSAKATFVDCHVLEGSTITNSTNRTSVANGNLGGFIGFADTKASVLTISGCSAHVDLTVDNLSTYNSCFIGGSGYASTITITDSYSAGKVNGNNYVGGFFGAAQSDITIERCWSSADVTVSGQRSSSFVGTSTQPIIIRDCYSTGDITASGQQIGGILGYTSKTVTIQRCYSAGDITSNTAGTAGIVGTNDAAGSIIEDCIAWNANIICNRSADDKWAPGAIVGATNGKASTFRGCYRRADMNFYDKAGAMTLVDHDDVVDGLPAAPSYSTAVTQNAYHGIAAEAGATLSSVATFVGWDETVWDLSGDVPVLK